MGLFWIHSEALIAVNNSILEDVVTAVFVHDFPQDLLRIRFMVLIFRNFGDLAVLFDHLLFILLLFVFLRLNSVHDLEFDGYTTVG